MADNWLDEDSTIKKNDGENGSLIGLYFQEASRHPLLGAAEEIRLSRKLARCYRIIAEELQIAEDEPLTFIKTAGCITHDRALSVLCRRAFCLATACRSRFIERNLRLSVHIAKRYSRGDVPMSDLIQEGNIGLIKAVDRFAPSKGFRFSTYAHWWISQEVNACARRGIRSIRVPDNVEDEVRDYRKASVSLYQSLGRAPTQSELARALGVSALRISDLRAFMANEVSTNKSLVDDSSATFVDTLEANESLTPEYQLFGRDCKHIVELLVGELTPREKDILLRRYGIDIAEAQTLQVISDSLGISRERVRQIEKTAIKKLSDFDRELEVFH